MAAMMLTASDPNGGLLDLTDHRFNSETWHGQQARRAGRVAVCAGCQAPVHLVRSARGRWFWRHNPGTRKQCILSEFHCNESDEHVEAKYTLVERLRALNWNAQPERVFGGGEARVDVWAERDGHHRGWEVQLSAQTSADFIERTRRVERLAALEVGGSPRVAWLTPHDRPLGSRLGVVTSPDARMVVGRIYRAPDEESAPLDHLSLAAFTSAVNRSSPALMFGQSGDIAEDGERRWIAYPVGSVGSGTASRRTGTSDLSTPDDRSCERPSATRRTTPPPPSEPTDDAGFTCGTCGLSDRTFNNQRSFWKPKPCLHCAPHFIEDA
jgi:hypothetical protein